MSECAPACSCLSSFYWLAPFLPLFIAGLVKAIVGLKNDRIAFEGFCEVEGFTPTGGFPEKMAIFLLNMAFYFLHPFLMLGVVGRVQAYEKMKQINKTLSPRKVYAAVKDKVYNSTEKVPPKVQSSPRKSSSRNRSPQSFKRGA